ncbi:endonuclease III domain-containing protein [Candidatus Vampirococcus lugosii]|uniref:Endonuclease III n=1 Tax=Candidatus Vampirococcus lugosii TaxID=2789015 RepID=A0ABS5QKD0_9BACT|nr:endonuclease III [Candidatus Vampirococcus lugosii]MBS8121542.1 endonuclease III [Candidatus Vampirococcus lugosii]
MNNIDINYILDQLEKEFPDAKIQLNYKTPFQLLISIMLSAQSTDIQVNKTTAKFYDYINSPKDILDIGLDNFKEKIKSIGLYNSKGNNIYKTSNILYTQSLNLSKNDIKNNLSIIMYEKYGYMISDNLYELIKFPGVGEKTAKVFLSEYYKIPTMPVDTHIHRIVNRIGIVKTKREVQTSKILEEIIPNNRKNKAHQLFIFFGRYQCLAKNPKCKNCLFNNICQYYKNL